MEDLKKFEEKSKQSKHSIFEVLWNHFLVWLEDLMHVMWFWWDKKLDKNSVNQINMELDKYEVKLVNSRK
jgi:hypothetical protein